MFGKDKYILRVRVLLKPLNSAVFREHEPCNLPKVATVPFC